MNGRGRVRGEPDTIVAIATAPGRGGVGIVRLSGPRAKSIGQALSGRETRPRQAVLARFCDEEGAVLDRGLVLFFPGPGSFTGEDVIELHAHGGPALLRLLVSRCQVLGARPAQPGEFSQRAFLNGKIDLTQAESIADLIDAASATAVHAAARNMEGAFSRAVERTDQVLTELRALVEAGIDFPEEEGVELVPEAALSSRLAALRDGLAELLAKAKRGRLLGDGLHIVLVGPPNVGKSSLLNRLAGRDVAIVTPVPGTTRDALREALEIGGIPLHLVDTAGLRESADEIEILGMERTRRAIAQADLALMVSAPPFGAGETADLVDELPADLPRIFVHNKIDLSGEPAGLWTGQAPLQLGVSAVTGAGIEALERAILETVGWREEGSEVLMAHARHIEALQETLSYLEKAAVLLAEREIFAEELRLAHRALGRICGQVVSDELLGEIFGRFCIGK